MGREVVIVGTRNSIIGSQSKMRGMCHEHMRPAQTGQGLAPLITGGRKRVKRPNKLYNIIGAQTSIVSRLWPPLEEQTNLFVI
jgi:hypothetical protein